MEENNLVAIDRQDPVTEILPDEEQGKKRAGDNIQKLIKERLEQLPKIPVEERTIFRLPDWYHEVHSDLFEPKVVSIGPFHHGNPKFHYMEEQKWSLLRNFLAEEQNVGIEVYIEAIRPLENRARQCYGESVDIDSDHFVMMLLLDGYFLLWLLENVLPDQIPEHYGWILNDLLNDIILIENQLPFFVIHKIFCIQHSLVDYCIGSCKLLDLSFKCGLFYYCIAISASLDPPEVSCNDICHFLHLHHTCMVNNPNKKERRSLRGETRPLMKFIKVLIDAVPARKKLMPDIPILDMKDKSKIKKYVTSPKGTPSASVLNDAGVRFRKKRNPVNMFDITFTNGTLEIPFTSIDYADKIILSNFAVFEETQFWKNLSRSRFSTPCIEYLTIMDALVNTEKDVILLQRSKILENTLPSEQDAATFFNDLGRLCRNHKMKQIPLFDELRKYGNSRWHMYRAKLAQDYFSNPWSAISVVAAGVLLVLTVLQTIYTMK